ncbi:MAG: tetratricopeptide repeat protein [Erythrobacter sp.]
MLNNKSLRRSRAAFVLFLAPVMVGGLAACDSGPSDPFAAAQTAFENSEPRTALDLIGQAIEADPENPAIRMMAGDIAMALGNSDRAIAEFDRVPETAPQYSLARAKLAEAQVMGNFLQAASETVDTLLMDNAMAYTASIGLKFSQGETDAGFELLDRGLATFPDDPRLVTIDAERLWAQGKAEETFARLQPVLEVRPAVPQAHLFAGQLRLGTRDAVQAQAHFQNVLTVHPNHQTAMLAMAAIARDRGDTQEAANWINKANEAGKPHPIGLLFAAQMAYDAGEITRAFELIEQAPPVFSSEPEFARLRGFIDAGRDQHAMAAMALGDYVKDTGGDPLARQVLADSLAQQGDFEGAWNAIEPVVDHPQMDGAGLLLALRLSEETGRGDSDQIRSLIQKRDGAPSIAAQMREAGAAIRSGDWAEADGIYAPLIDGAGRTDPALLNNAAAVKTKLNQHDAAVALARRALEEAPNSPEIMDTLAWALWEKGGAITEAREYSDQARQGAPSNREILEHWAIIHAD